MNHFSPAIDALIQALKTLPSVGPKSAQRLALHLLNKGKSNAKLMAEAIEHALDVIVECQRCQMLTDKTLCPICENEKRNDQLLCIVESQQDVYAIEQTGQYQGRYFVLKGHLSPLDGIGPEQIGIPKLLELFQATRPNEVILATNPTVEGETTAQYLAQALQAIHPCTISRIAHGVPMGSELEYIDGNTLSRAMLSRQTMIQEET